MRKRVTINDLRNAVDWLNQITDSPRDARTDGQWNVGHFLIYSAYGGHSLKRICEGGGHDTPAEHGFMPARDLLRVIRSYGYGYGCKK